MLRVCLLGILFWLFVATPALGQAKTPTPEEKAFASFSAAEIYYKAAEYQKALEGYQEAFRLSQEPDLHFNIAQCYRHLGKKEEAIASYKAFLQTATDAESIKKAEAWITELEASSAAPKDEPKEGGSLKRFMLPGGLLAVSLGCGATALVLKSKFSEPDEAGVVTQTLGQHRLGLALALAADAAMIGAGVSLVFALKQREVSAKITPTANGAVASLSF